MKINSLKSLSSYLNQEVLSDTEISGFAVDSRLVEKGNVFFALPGQNVDGHDFLENAAKKGASCLVVQKKYTGSNFNLPVFFVDDTLLSLQQLTKEILKNRQSKIVAITGSVGKTTTKDFITTILSEKFLVFKTPGNANSQIGLPLSILNHTDGTEDVLVLEMGMNEKGQLEKLIEIAPPDIAVLTHVALTHAGNFKNLKEIALAKAEIFKSEKTKIGILNCDIENFHEIMSIGSCSKIPFSVVSRQADFYLDNFTIHTLNNGFLNLDPTLHPFFGKHHYQNLLAAVAVAFHLGLNVDQIKKAEKKLKLPTMRFEIVEKNGITFVNDSYNASEISVIAALQALPFPKFGGRTIAVIGEMLELGDFSAKCHERVAETALKHADLMFLLGSECAPIFNCWNENKKPVEWFLDRSELEKSLKQELRAGDVVLLKGSRANELWKILEGF